MPVEKSELKEPDHRETDLEVDLEALADIFLNLWQDNVRTWSEENGLFSLQRLTEALKPLDTPLSGDVDEE